jgi:hypothetical protein
LTVRFTTARSAFHLNRQWWRVFFGYSLAEKAKVHQQQVSPSRALTALLWVENATWTFNVDDVND